MLESLMGDGCAVDRHARKAMVSFRHDKKETRAEADEVSKATALDYENRGLGTDNHLIVDSKEDPQFSKDNYFIWQNMTIGDFVWFHLNMTPGLAQIGMIASENREERNRTITDVVRQEMGVYRHIESVPESQSLKHLSRRMNIYTEEPVLLATDDNVMLYDFLSFIWDQRLDSYTTIIDMNSYENILKENPLFNRRFYLQIGDKLLKEANGYVLGTFHKEGTHKLICSFQGGRKQGGIKGATVGKYIWKALGIRSIPLLYNFWKDDSPEAEGIKEKIKTWRNGTPEQRRNIHATWDEANYIVNTVLGNHSLITSTHDCAYRLRDIDNDPDFKYYRALWDLIGQNQALMQASYPHVELLYKVNEALAPLSRGPVSPDDFVEYINERAEVFSSKTRFDNAGILQFDNGLGDEIGRLLTYAPLALARYNRHQEILRPKGPDADLPVA